MAKYDFDAVVIGGGAAGLTASALAANFGAKTLLIEARRLGGECTWTGCIPSKILLKAGKVAHQIRSAGKYGLVDLQPEINFKKLIKHLWQLREEIYNDADRPEIYEEMGVEIATGQAKFTDEHSIEISTQNGGTKRVTAKYFFICTGSIPAVPAVEGIDRVRYVTNESLFEIEELPGRLLIIGAGPAGIEMAQAFQRLGSAVTVVEMTDRILTKDDPELANLLKEQLEKEGVVFLLNATTEQITHENDNIKLVAEVGGEKRTVSADRLLIAAGRRPSVEKLDLPSAGVNFLKNGIQVNDQCQTNQSHIYACGDVTGRYQLTHMSDHMAKVAVTNALLKYPMNIDREHVPWCTYTEPELAHLGASEQELEEQGISFETYRFPYSKIDRAIAESEKTGLLKVFAKRWNGRILGAGILGARAGELISEYAVAMKHGVTLRNLADTIHPYPSYGLGARRAADQWYIKKQSQWTVKLVRKIFGYQGNIPDYSDSDRIV